MLASIRKFSKSFVAKIFVAIIALPFIMWGMGDVFRSGKQNVIVEINDEKINSKEFITYIQKINLSKEEIDRVGKSKLIDDILTNSSDFSMEDMINLQVDYHSTSSEKLIKMLSESFDEQNKYYKLLSTWDNKLSKDSVAAGLYNAWELTVLMEFNKQYVPIKVQKYIQMQLYKIIEKLEGFSEKDRNRFIKSSFNQAVELMITWFGEETENWVYGQENYKHVKIKHPLEEIVTDSVYNLISLKAYPRGGNGYTPGSTGYNLNQSSGGSFRVLINTGDWDNSFATNSPGQSGDPDSKFYDNLYEDWANDIYFPLLYSKSKILRNLENRKVYYPQD